MLANSSLDTLHFTSGPGSWPEAWPAARAVSVHRRPEDHQWPAERAAILQHLDELVARRQSREGARNYALLVVDLDRFHRVNARFGDHAGDLVLAAVGRRLRHVVRRRGVVGHLGGDRFAIVLEHVRTRDARADAARLVRRAFTAAFRVVGEEVFLTGSIGIVLGSSEPRTARELLQDADTAVSHARSARRGGAALFDATMRVAASRELRLESDLRAAVARQEFELHYQPIVSALGEIVAFEALVRWNHPVRGLLGPGEFLDALHETGLIIPVGRWVVHEACRYACRLVEAQVPAPVTVNLSAQQLEHPDLLIDVASALRSSGASPSMLLFEITEEALLHKPLETAERLRALRERGVGLLMDDFGTGYSSLAYLRDFPVDVLKIARPLLRDVEQSGARREIVRTVVALAHTLGLQVVAEGVETDEQLTAVRELGCDWVQGYYLSRPVDAGSALALARRYRSEAVS